MDHERATENLGPLRDGELGAAEKAETLAHLDDCAACRARAAALGRLSAALFRPPAPPTRAQTELFAQAVLRRLQPRESPLWAWLDARWLTPALSAAAVALFVFIARPSPDAVAPADVLLLAGEGDVAQLVLPPDPARRDDMLAFITEDR